MPFLKCNVHQIPRSKYLENLAQRQGLRHAIVTPWWDTYIGEWKSSKKDGYGQMVTRSWRLYEGQWWKDYRHNYGIAARRDDDKVYQIEYRGHWRLGHYHGYGEKHYPDHGYYKGYFKNSKRHGYGQMWYADGCFYDGDWLKDLKDGLGLFVFTNGNRYEGYWKNDLRHGKGRYFHLDSGQMQEGVWDRNNCVTSFVVDIPFRQTAIYPTEYPIRENELDDPNGVYARKEEEIMHDLFDKKSTGSTCDETSTINK